MSQRYWKDSFFLTFIVILSVLALIVTQVASHRIRRNLGPVLEPLGSRMIIGDPPFQEYFNQYQKTFHNNHNNNNNNNCENEDGLDIYREAQCASCADGSI
jgi:hypothetical protein